MDGLSVSPCGDPLVVGMRAVSPSSVLMVSHVLEYSSRRRIRPGRRGFLCRVLPQVSAGSLQQAVVSGAGVWIRPGCPPGCPAAPWLERYQSQVLEAVEGFQFDE
eukprot:3938332-Rhodomonas_salina.1